ncbi:MAG TPA: NUDIX domain-containing protein [Flavobacteriales bacterium]|nr:NUDIX domain-containing protein [Flavobacteriales bacterium]
MDQPFTIRVYGLLLDDGRLLVADEIIKGQRITKFPGGGLEFGEGLKDGLIREIREEIGVDAYDLEHFYTTDFFQQSVFHSTPMQVISVYYTFRVAHPAAISVVAEPFTGISGAGDQEVFRWLQLRGSRQEDLSLPIDRVVWRMLMEGPNA